ncbi:SEC-C domain-containing protein [Herbaspirillum sp. DW155]|uniref:YchJ family protein n=1 Tax=Herbaspirillum sp. DW155 TaxID=3095609 RepID=UPI003085BB39|nr:SEC-C domain-containing protein [Herbaspirillum sp. DW155]
MSNKKDKSGPCPCGQPSFEKCCGRFLSGGEIPATAELLMRSRYTAFALRDEAYLRATWFPDTLPEEELTSETDVKWIGLDIRKHQHASGSDEATVEFVARFKVGGKAHRLHEISNFVRQPDESGQARWYYVDGRFPED